MVQPMFFLLLTIGRIAGGVVLTKIKPRPAFRISALMGVVGACLLMTGSTSLAIAGVLLGGLGFCQHMAIALFYHCGGRAGSCQMN